MCLSTNWYWCNQSKARLTVKIAGARRNNNVFDFFLEATICSRRIYRARSTARILSPKTSVNLKKVDQFAATVHMIDDNLDATGYTFQNISLMNHWIISNKDKLFPCAHLFSHRRKDSTMGIYINHCNSRSILTIGTAQTPWSRPARKHISIKH